jgi:hypothetical protein
MMLVSVLFGIGLLAADAPKSPADEKRAPEVKPADELDKLREQIARDMQAVEKKLKDSDAGGETQQLQNQVLENLDKLLERAKNPPPPSESPMGGSAPKDAQSSGQSQSQPSSAGTQSRREKRAAERRQQQQARGQQQRQSGPTSAAPGLGANGNPPPDRRMTMRTGPAESLADVAKDIWGNLPDTLRQEFDHYYREQFMPRYRDLLQQYYLRLAETERRQRDTNP